MECKNTTSAPEGETQADMNRRLFREIPKKVVEYLVREKRLLDSERGWWTFTGDEKDDTWNETCYFCENDPKYIVRLGDSHLPSCTQHSTALISILKNKNDNDSLADNVNKNLKVTDHNFDVVKRWIRQSFMLTLITVSGLFLWIYFYK